MPNDTTDPKSALSQLTTDIADIVKGYEVMEERADDDLQPIAQRLHALHETHAADLVALLDDMGERPDDPGSVMGAVHAAVATGRDWVDALDLSALPRIISGEERLLASYDDAIKATQGLPDVSETLISQRAGVEAQIAALADD